MWILHDKTFPAAGQVAPALSLDGSIQSEGDQVSIGITQNHPDLVAMLANAVHRAGFIP